LLRGTAFLLAAVKGHCPPLFIGAVPLKEP
jgi:hypothetical protein